MANSLTSVLFFSFAISLMVQSSNSIKCYSCVELNGSKAAKLAKIFSTRANIPDTPSALCPDDMSDAEPVECATDDVCFKLDAEQDGVEAVMRVCGNKDLCTIVAADTNCNSCDTDKCNGAASMTATAILITVPALLWKFY